MTLGSLIRAPAADAMQAVVLTLAVAILAVASAAVVVMATQACIAPAASPELPLGCKCDQPSGRLSFPTTFFTQHWSCCSWPPCV
jgi:hypothetical protein